MVKKYELGEEREIDGIKMHRIVALVDLPPRKDPSLLGGVRRGDIGGWVESEYNLSHYGDCWVYHDAMVLGKAKVLENASILGRARVSGSSLILGCATVGGDSSISDCAKVSEYADVRGGNIYGSARIYGSAIIKGRLCEVCDNACVYDHASIDDSAKVWGNAVIHGRADLRGEINISDPFDILVIGPIIGSGVYLTLANGYSAMAEYCGDWDGLLRYVPHKHHAELHTIFRLAKSRFDSLLDY